MVAFLCAQTQATGKNAVRELFISIQRRAVGDYSVKVTIVILLLAMFAKDLSHINDPYNLMRGFSQGLALLVGLLWMSGHFNATLLRKYWPIFGYLFVSFISGLFSPFTETALIQTASLVAVLFFAIAYFESQSRKPGDSTALYLNTVTLVYTGACFIGLLMIKLDHSVAYAIIGNWVTDPAAAIRYRGIFPISGMLGAGSGLLFGIVLFRRGKWWWRAPALTAGLLSLALTQSRTFWVATFAASILIGWIYTPRYRKLFAAATFAALIAVAMVEVLGLHVNTHGIREDARIGSIDNLTGRIPLWEHTIKAFSYHPFIGYGSTLGSYALAYGGHTGTIADSVNRTARSLSTETTHNGYFQTMLDLGVFGLFFYVAIFATAIRRMYLRDKLRQYPAIGYIVVFMAVGNLAESIVYSAGVSHAIVFWIAVVFALHRFAPGVAMPVRNKKLVFNETERSARNNAILDSRKRKLI